MYEKGNYAGVLNILILIIGVVVSYFVFSDIGEDIKQRNAEREQAKQLQELSKEYEQDR